MCKLPLGCMNMHESFAESRKPPGNGTDAMTCGVKAQAWACKWLSFSVYTFLNDGPRKTHTIGCKHFNNDSHTRLVSFPLYTLGMLVYDVSNAIADILRCSIAH